MVAYYTLKEIDSTNTVSTSTNSTWSIVDDSTACSGTTISFSEPEYVWSHIPPAIEESIDRIKRIKFECKIMRDWNNYQLFSQALRYNPKIMKGYNIPTTHKCRNILKYNTNYGRKGRK